MITRNKNAPNGAFLFTNCNIWRHRSFRINFAIATIHTVKFTILWMMRIQWYGIILYFRYIACIRICWKSKIESTVWPTAFICIPRIARRVIYLWWIRDTKCFTRIIICYHFFTVCTRRRRCPQCCSHRADNCALAQILAFFCCTATGGIGNAFPFQCCIV